VLDFYNCQAVFIAGRSVVYAARSLMREGKSIMNRKQTKNQIKQLKQELHAVNREHDYRLLKLALMLVILAAIAALIYNKIPI